MTIAMAGVSPAQSWALEITMATSSFPLWPTPQPWPGVPNGTATDPVSLSDADLVEAAKMGDATAFGRLIQRQYRFCLSKAYSILRNHGDAEDEVQNACAKAWEHLSQFQGEGTFGGWLSRIVSNQCLMRIRERNVTRMVSVDEVLSPEGSFRLEVIDQRALPEDIVGDDQVSRVLNKEIAGVPPLLREALVMRDIEQASMRDIAEHLGISLPAAKSRLMRARLELRQRMEKHHGAKGGGALLQKSARRRAACVRAN